MTSSLTRRLNLLGTFLVVEATAAARLEASRSDWVRNLGAVDRSQAAALHSDPVVDGRIRSNRSVLEAVVHSRVVAVHSREVACLGDNPAAADRSDLGDNPGGVADTPLHATAGYVDAAAARSQRFALERRWQACLMF